MSNELPVLRLTQKEVVPNVTYVYQTDDGMLFYKKDVNQHRLYVKWNSKEVDARLPDGAVLWTVATHGNEVYFVVKQPNRPPAVYKAYFVAPRLCCDFVREVNEEDAKLVQGGVISIDNPTKYAYHLWETHGGVVIDVPETKLRGMTLIGTHRGKAYYIQLFEKLYGPPTVTKLSEKVLAITLPYNASRLSLLMREAWSLIYFENERNLIVLDTDTMEFLPALRIEDVEYECNIAGVHGGLLYVLSRGRGTWYLATTQLPAIYLHTADAAVRRKATAERAHQQHPHPTGPPSGSVVSQRGGHSQQPRRGNNRGHGASHSGNYNPANQRPVQDSASQAPQNEHQHKAGSKREKKLENENLKLKEDMADMKRRMAAMEEAISKMTGFKY